MGRVATAIARDSPEAFSRTTRGRGERGVLDLKAKSHSRKGREVVCDIEGIRVSGYVRLYRI